MASPIPPSPPTSIVVVPNPSGVGRLLVVRHAAINTLADGLQIPLDEGMDLIAGAFHVMAHTPDVAPLFATRFQSSQMVETMRNFVAGHDQWKAQQAPK